MRRVTLRAERSWKGVETQDVVVLTGWGGGDCGFPFERGESYLVFPGERDNRSLATGICSGTASLARADADLRRWPDRTD